MINEISAEMLLEFLYPELEQKWIVHNKGTFYRNYNSDDMHIYEDERLVELSRDGFLGLLPNALLSGEDELAGTRNSHRQDKTAKLKRIKMRLHTLREGFAPIDTFNFRQRLTLERKTQELLDLKLAIVLKEYFNIELDKITDPYVIQVAVLLPYVSTLRGDINFIAQLLEQLTGYPVRTRHSAFSSTDNTRCWMPKIHYDIIVDGLSRKKYLAMTEKLQPLIDFITEYFIPFDCFSEIGIKSSSHINMSGNDTKTKEKTLLNYNTYV